MTISAKPKSAARVHFPWRNPIPAGEGRRKLQFFDEPFQIRLDRCHVALHDIDLVILKHLQVFEARAGEHEDHGIILPDFPGGS